MSHPIAPDTLRALAHIDTCSVANAIECFNVRLRNEGFTDASIRCRLPDLPPMVGYAMTLRVRSSTIVPKRVNTSSSRNCAYSSRRLSDKDLRTGACV